jgi:hypothetical protein
MLRRENRAASRPAFGVLTLFGVLACSGAGDGARSATAGLAEPAAPGSGRTIGHVGNQASGIDAIPDWDAAALRVREQIDPRLPRPLPAPKDACAAMLDAAVRYYASTEGDRSPAVVAIERTRTADERACAADTSPAAATCVTILLGESAGEYPWLVDQCTRAFPRA